MEKTDQSQSSFSQESADPIIDMAINLARISTYTYQYGDRHGAPYTRHKERVLSVIIEPIEMRKKEHQFMSLK